MLADAADCTAIMMVGSRNSALAIMLRAPGLARGAESMNQRQRLELGERHQLGLLLHQLWQRP